MKRRSYRERLVRAVRWRVSETDANEIISDYDEILSQWPDNQDDAIIENIGEPVQVARMLVQKKEYHRWLLVFCSLIFCLFLQESVLLGISFGRGSSLIVNWFFLLGLVISLLYIIPHHKIKDKRSRSLLVLLLVMLVSTAVGFIFLIGLLMQLWTTIPDSQYGPISYCVLLFLGTTSAILGVYGLVQARLENRRWIVLYVLGLSILTACAIFFIKQTSLYCNWSDISIFSNLIFLCAGSILGMVISLC